MEEESKEKFLKIFKQNVKREGADSFLEWLETTDFFTAPASSKFHSCHEGGLCEHSLNAYNRLSNLVKQEYGDDWEKTISAESVAIISLLHDLCKVNTYKKDFRNVKVNGEWLQQVCYKTEDTLPYGHGEKSVYILCGFMRLTREEAMAINWHMGGFDTRVKGGSYAIEEAFSRFPIALLMHIADLQSAYLDEKSN